ncbi:MAG: hypothetical protein QM734_13630 [Cyclobacteriaceae bacterium]
MKSLNIRSLIYAGLIASVLSSCLKGDPINLPPGATGNIISVAVNSNGVWQATPDAVAVQFTDSIYNVILITLSSANGPASQDIHVTLVKQPDSLPNYNSLTYDEHDPNTGEVTVSHPEKYLAIAGTAGSPDFAVQDTLQDGSVVVTIPKGKSYGYMKVKTVSHDWLGTNFAFVYRIASVQESGYTISAQNGYSITPFQAKNAWDGVYDLSLNTQGWGAYGIADDDEYRDYGNIALSTTGATGDILLNLVAASQLQPAFTTGGASATQFGAATPNFTFDPTTNAIVDVFNSVPDDGRGRKFAINPAATASENLFDPSTHNITFNYLMFQNGRPNQTIRGTMTYKGSR